MKRLSASAGSDAKEIGIVGHLDFAFLAGEVYADRQSLTVGIVGGQRCLLRLL